nr:hypothetical protein [Tanacetum cinerariifolium]
MGTTRDTLGTADDGGVTFGIDRPHTYNDLNEHEKKRFDADIQATNILYDEFKRFKMTPGENITDYYVKFYKLVNDMRNIKMTMPNIQLNSKFVNNMTHEWDRFVTAVKLNKGLKETNHEQIYAYMKQHEKHVAYDRLINDRFNPTTNDPLAPVSHVQPHTQVSHVQSHQYPTPSSHVQPLHVHTSQNPYSVENSQLDSGYTQTGQIIDNLSNQIALLAQQFRATLPQTNNKLRTSLNTHNQETVQDGRVVIQNVQGRHNQNQRNFARGIGAARSGNTHNRAGNANQGQGKPIKCYNCGENRVVLDEEALLFLAGEQANTYDADVDDHPVYDMAQNDHNIFQADDCDAFDSDIDDEPTTQTIFMANLSSAVSSLQQAGPSNASILSEVLNLENAINHHEIYNKVQQTNVLDSDSADMGNSDVIPYEQYVKHKEESVVHSGASSVQYDDYMLHENSAYVPDDSFTTTLNIYKDQVAIYEQRAKFKLINREQKMDDQMRMLIQERNFREEKLKKELQSLQLQLNHTIHHKKIMQDSIYTLQQDFKQKEMKLLNDFSQLKTLKNKLENKLYAHDQSTQTVHMMLKPKTVCDEHSEKNIVDPTLFTLKRLKWFNLPYMMVRITPTGITEGEKGFEQTKRCYLTEVIPFFKLLKEHFEGVQKTLVTEVKDMKEIFKSTEDEVDQNAIDLRSGKIERTNLLITNENLIAKCIAQDVFYIVTNSALTASQFHELSIAYNVAQTRVVELEAENLNLHKKIQNDDHDNMVKHLSRLEVDNLNLQLKYQHLKERTESSKSRTSKDAPEFDAFFELNEKDAQLQTHRNTIRKLKDQISQLKANKSDVTGTLFP